VSTPISTVEWFEAVSWRQWNRVVVFGAVTLVLNGIMMWGLIRARREWVLIGLLGLVSSLFPVALMNHVSETYLSPAIFWYAILAALSLGVVGREVHSVLYRGFCAVAVAVLLAFHGWAFLSKVNMMALSGAAEVRAANMAAQRLETIPPGSTVMITSAAEGLSSYSVLRSFSPAPAIVYISGRHRLPIRFVSEGNADYELMISRDSIILRRHG
jgi:hypothetical protein